MPPEGGGHGCMCARGCGQYMNTCNMCMCMYEKSSVRASRGILVLSISIGLCHEAAHPHGRARRC